MTNETPETIEEQVTGPQVDDAVVRFTLDMPYEEFGKYNMGLDIARQFEWGINSSSMSYDFETEEIVISETALMRIIQMVNPAQPTRKIRMVPNSWDVKEAREKAWQAKWQDD